MKKLFFLKPLPLIFFAAMCANADVVSSGKWSENSTWSEASAPTTSSSNPYTDLSFASSGITLEVDSNQYADRIQLGSTADTTITIDAGASLTLLGYDAKVNSNGGPYYYISANDVSDKLTFTGDGELVLSRTNETRFEKGQIVWDVNVTATTGSFYCLNGVSNASSLTINKSANLQNRQANFGSWKIVLNSGANVTSGFLISSGSMEIASEATYNASGGATLNNLTLNGSMSISNWRDYQAERMAAKISGTSVFGETASFTTTSTDSKAKVLFNGNVTSNAAKNAINIAGTAFLNNNVVMNLNSSNAIKTGSASGQGDSTFYIVNYSTPKVGENSYVDTFEASTATINLGADNDFGTFIFYDNSQLNLSTNGYKSTIGKIELYSGSGAYTINISNLTDFTLKINSLENINYEDDGAGNMWATDIFIYEVEGDYRSNAYLIADTNGGWWINATSEIPEPAEIAAIFGALALGLACCRKRK